MDWIPVHAEIVKRRGRWCAQWANPNRRSCVQPPVTIPVERLYAFLARWLPRDAEAQKRGADWFIVWRRPAPPRAARSLPKSGVQCSIRIGGDAALEQLLVEIIRIGGDASIKQMLAELCALRGR